MLTKTAALVRETLQDHEARANYRLLATFAVSYAILVAWFYA